MRLTRSARNLRRIPAQPVTPPPTLVGNYTLARFTVGKSGFIFGVNRFGSRWIEVHIGGVTLLTWFAINNNPYVSANTPKRNTTAAVTKFNVKRRVTA